MKIRDDFWRGDYQFESVRKGFGRGLVAAGAADERVVALSADLTESVGMAAFERQFGSRFIQVGVAEQNLVTVASGLARAGKHPFAGSYAAFSPGRNWEQIRTTICLNDVPVTIVGSHAGLTVGPDGATHQCLEDIALMRSLPNMIVLAPADSTEAEAATQALAKTDKPSYLRLARNDTPRIFEPHQFEIGKAYNVYEGDDVTLAVTGTMLATALQAAMQLQVRDVHVDVVHCPTIKPLDEATILESIGKTGRLVTLEEGQIAAGFGSAVSEVVSHELPVPTLRLGVDDRFGQSGAAEELLREYGLDAQSVAQKIADFVDRVPQYRRGYTL